MHVNHRCNRKLLFVNIREYPEFLIQHGYNAASCNGTRDVNRLTSFDAVFPANQDFREYFRQRFLFHEYIN